MSTGLEKVVERAKRDPTARFNSLAHLLDEQMLKSAFHRIRKDAAEGVDGVTKEDYGSNLDENIQDLLRRLKTKRYRHQPIRRKLIPKGKGKYRPIGISSVEDKIVQSALTTVLNAIYEQDFHPDSYGFRKKRGAHDALRALDHMVFREGVSYILEADIQSYFDSIDRTKLRRMLRERVVDGSLLRLIGKCLHVGVLDGAEFTKPDEGTAQGSVISPLLGNVYLHYVLDDWFEHVVRGQLKGHARIIRYADDFVIGFSYKNDAELAMELLVHRMAEYNLTLHPEKTRLIPFGRPRRNRPGGKGPGTFDFLGFTIYWQKTRKGGWRLGMKTRKARLKKALKAIGDFCRSHRHKPLKEQHAALSRRINGHNNYFGVNGNMRCLSYLLNRVERVWFKWLRRRSQRARRKSWEGFGEYLRQFPLPQPRIKVQIWGGSS